MPLKAVNKINGADLEYLINNTIIQRYQSTNDRIVTIIGERVKRTGYLNSSDAQALKNIADLTGDLENINRILAQTTNQSIAEVYQIYQAAAEQQYEAAKFLYEYRGKPFTPFAENARAQAITAAFAKQTAGEMRNFGNTKMLSLLDRNGNTVKFAQAYQEIIDQAVYTVSSGIQDFPSAMREALSAVGGGGLRVDYPSGATRRVDTVVRQNILYGAKQQAIYQEELIGMDIGADVAFIDYHYNPRPSHVVIGGLAVSLTGKDEYFEEG